MPQFFAPGTYRFHLVITGDNLGPVKKTATVSFDGAWNDDLNVFKAEHLELSVK